MPIHLFVALSLAIGPVLATGGDGAVMHQDPVESKPVDAHVELERWLLRFEARATLWSGALDELEGILSMAIERAKRNPAARAEVTRDLLTVAAYGIGWLPRAVDYKGAEPKQRLRGVGLDALDRLLAGPAGEEALDWIMDEVVARAEGRSVGQRYLALHVLQAREDPRSRLALLSVARNERDPLRPEVLKLLPAFDDEAVDLFLVGLLGKKHDRRRDPHPFNLMLERTRSGKRPLGLRATDALIVRLEYMLRAADWREASRAIELSRSLVLDRAVPLLLDGLFSVDRRLRFGSGSRRIQHELVRELRRVSGRSIGTNPKNWNTWWIAYRQGRVDIPDPEDREEEEKTHAEFFGLRPISDRVTFVIDHSGSMRSEWGTTGRSRYEEAVEQMTLFLQGSGERTQFNVILFNSETLRSSPGLIQATAENLEKARTSLLERIPDGGTLLRPAVELALRLDERGSVDPDVLEADTIIVLCDGETQSGRGWVRPLLKRVQADARIVFHCVLVGIRGDGTLQELAKNSGGDFIRIGG